MLLRAATTLRKLRATLATGAGRCLLDRRPDAVSREPIAQSRLHRQAADAIAPVLVSGNVVILESTSPVGTTRAVGRRGWPAAAGSPFPAGEALRSRSTCMSRIARSGCCPAEWCAS